MQYTKLFSSLIDSTIWREEDTTRLLWVTMLAKADRDGIVHASIPGLADAARISIDAAESGLAKLMEPDPYSRTKAHGGRRIEEVRGGWLLLNHGHYRRLLSREERKAYQAEWARKKREREKRTVDSAVDTRRQKSTLLTQAEAEAEADNALNFEASGVIEAGTEPEPESSKFKAFPKTIPHEEEAQLVQLCIDTFGVGQMVNYGGSWRLRARDNPDKLKRVLSEIRTMQKEGKAIRDAAAAANDLWERWK